MNTQIASFAGPFPVAGTRVMRTSDSGPTPAEINELDRLLFDITVGERYNPMAYLTDEAHGNPSGR